MDFLQIFLKEVAAREQFSAAVLLYKALLLVVVLNICRGYVQYSTSPRVISHANLARFEKNNMTEMLLKGAWANLTTCHDA